MKLGIEETDIEHDVSWMPSIGVFGSKGLDRIDYDPA